MDKITNVRIKQLKEEKKYDEIFNEFGSEVYRKSIPLSYKRKELRQLKKEGRYFDIYNKYGEEAYNGILIKAMYEERKEAKGNLNASFWRVKENFKNAMKKIAVVFSSVVLLAPPTFAVQGALTIEKEIEKNSIENAEEIKAYNKKINEYAKQINAMNLSDIKIFMKVMDDMWQNIQGYATPEKDIIGFYELDLATKDGYGVCRNMASDVARKLNAINPKYNARTMVVRVDDNGKYFVADIERKKAHPKNKKEANNTQKANQEEQTNETLKKVAENIFGNHLVTLVDSDENAILVLDPTNPGIGVYKNGEIIMFNSSEVDKSKYISKEYISSFLLRGGLENIVDVIEDFAKSFEKTTVSMEELEERYGLVAQNKALDKPKDDKFLKSIIINLDENKNNTNTKKDNDNKDKIQEDEVR